MPIRCYYSLNPGEAIVAEAIIANRSGVNVFFPHKDTGIDLVVFSDLAKRSRRSVTIQVKESRYHGNSHSWHQVKASKLAETETTVDAYAFVTYREVPDGARMKWKNEFVVVPTNDLRKLVKEKHGGVHKVFGFYFAFEDGKAWDVREARGHIPDPNRGAKDYSKYYNNWDLLWTK